MCQIFLNTSSSKQKSYLCVLSAPFPLPVSDLQFKDCRLLEKWSNKEESLQQLVAALKAVASLHTLSLAQNRLGK